MRRVERAMSPRWVLERSSRARSLELGLLEDHVLADLRVILLKLKLAGAGAAILSRSVKITGACGALELDFIALWLCHGGLLKSMSEGWGLLMINRVPRFTGKVTG